MAARFVAVLAGALAVPLVALGGEVDSAPLRGAGSPRVIAGDAGDAGDAGGLPACVAVRGEARYAAAGYKHIVIVTNGCSRLAHCSVATNVNPTPQEVDVKSGTTVEVVTFLESPAYAFTPNVRCKL